MDPGQPDFPVFRTQQFPSGKHIVFLLPVPSLSLPCHLVTRIVSSPFQPLKRRSLILTYLNVQSNLDQTLQFDIQLKTASPSQLQPVLELREPQWGRSTVCLSLPALPLTASLPPSTGSGSSGRDRGERWAASSRLHAADALGTSCLASHLPLSRCFSKVSSSTELPTCPP